MQIETKQYGTHVFPEKWDLPMAGNTLGEVGNIACMNTSGLIVPASADATLRAIGKFARDANNLGGAASAVLAHIESGVFLLANGSGGDAFAATDRPGLPVFLSGPYTANKTDNGAARPFAGFFVGRIGGKVAVSISPLHQKPLTAAETLAVAGIRSGSVTLAAGTATVTQAGLTTSSRISVAMTAAGAGALTNLATFLITKAAGSFTVTAITDAGATINTAVPTLDWIAVG